MDIGGSFGLEKVVQMRFGVLCSQCQDSRDLVSFFNINDIGIPTPIYALEIFLKSTPYINANL